MSELDRARRSASSRGSIARSPFGRSSSATQTAAAPTATALGSRCRPGSSPRSWFVAGSIRATRRPAAPSPTPPPRHGDSSARTAAEIVAAILPARRIDPPQLRVEGRRRDTQTPPAPTATRRVSSLAGNATTRSTVSGPRRRQRAQAPRRSGARGTNRRRSQHHPRAAMDDRPGTPCGAGAQLCTGRRPERSSTSGPRAASHPVTLPPLSAAETLPTNTVRR